MFFKIFMLINITPDIFNFIFTPYVKNYLIFFKLFLSS